MSEFFHEAYRRARNRYTREQWLALPPPQMTDAIYREMREMDAERQPPGSAPEAPPRRRGRRSESTPAED